jgi:transposase-like protein/ribosomal protein L37AE/L43A
MLIRLTPHAPTGSMRPMSRPDFPRTLREFQRRFEDEAACRAYLAASRWPDGYRCPQCGGGGALELPTRLLWRCKHCRRDTSVTAGTVLHRTHTPLTQWFWAAYLVTTHTPGLSALQLQRQLGLRRYETAWAMLQKLRRAMVRPDRDRLRDKVEVDESYVGGPEAGLRGGRELRDKALVVAAVEVRGAASGRVRLQVVPDASGRSLTGFIRANVDPGTIVITDGWQGYAPLTGLGYRHRPRIQGDPARAEKVLPRVHRVFGNLKTWLRGTHHGVGHQHLQAYLDEFTFRFNRRRTPMAAFQTLLGLGTQLAPTTYRQLYAVESTG